MLSCHRDPFSAFVRDLQIDGCEVHLYRGPNTFFTLLSPEDDTGKYPIYNAAGWQDENIYFLAGVRPGLQKRAADNDVVKRGMFTLDFDIRKELEKEGQGSDIGVQTRADLILEALNNDALFAHYRYAVLSGNGLHVHYFGTPVRVDKERWVAGMKMIFALVNTITPIPCDTGCGNAGRIMRMPGSWNVKDPANVRPVTVEIWMPGVSFGNMEMIDEMGEMALAQANERKAAEKREFTETGSASDVIELINLIPIEQVVQQLPMGCKLKCVKKDGGMRFVDEKGTERGFFRHHQFNIIVHEGTSLFPPPAGVGYNCLGLAKVVLGVTTHDAVEWFCARSTPVREASAREKEEWARENTAKEVELFEKSLTDLPNV